ncbi:MAG: hypothetical protein JO210_03095 [Acidobacteriaceae bacterium]|nr:hypothetical protein [Acidobacteriaceae bacterium]
MSKQITVKLPEAVLDRADELAPKSPMKNRNAYIAEAIKRLNRVFEREALAKQFAFESNLVREESMKVLAGFESLDDPIHE